MGTLILSEDLLEDEISRIPKSTEDDLIVDNQILKFNDYNEDFVYSKFGDSMLLKKNH